MRTQHRRLGVAREGAEQRRGGGGAVKDRDVVRVHLQAKLSEEERDGLALGRLDVLAAVEVVPVPGNRARSRSAAAHVGSCEAERSEEERRRTAEKNKAEKSGAAHPMRQLALWSLPAPQLQEPSEQSTALEMSSSCTVPTERVIGAEPEAQMSRSSAPWPD